jgi:hypothetical protein
MFATTRDGETLTALALFRELTVQLPRGHACTELANRNPSRAHKLAISPANRNHAQSGRFLNQPRLGKHGDQSGGDNS